jgi:DNA-cytosine methyltransferase
MRASTMFSGIGAPEVAMPDWDWRWCAEIEPFPSAVHALRHGTPNLGNVSAEDFVDRAQNFGELDVVVYGSPCFPAGTLVLTSTGYTPIESVRVNDLVLTHKGRWKKVLRIGGRKNAPIISLYGQGMSGLKTTAEHPFFSRKKNFQSTSRNGLPVSIRSITNPEWTRADEMSGRFWAIPTKIEPINLPDISYNRRELVVDMSAPAFWRFIGRWLADGWLRVNQRSGRPVGEDCWLVVLCAKFSEELECKKILDDAGLKYSISYERTTVRFVIHRKALSRWLLEHFGQYADGKKIPSFVFGLSEECRRALLEGYLSGDGCEVLGGWRSTSVNKALSVGFGMLSASLGMTYSLRFSKPNREFSIIEGRKVKENGFWQMTVYKSYRSAFFADGFMWGLVRKKEDVGFADVFNLEVEDDNTYTADGIVVHNCQSFSFAGERLGLDDHRGNLALVALEVIRKLRPRWIVFENVPGLLGSYSGGKPEESEDSFDLFGRRTGGTGYSTVEERDFATLLSRFRECGYLGAWRVLDAQYFGVPQQRRRIFFVGYLGDWRPAASVLFERESLFGDTQKSARQKTKDESDFGKSLVSGFDFQNIRMSGPKTGTIDSVGQSSNRGYGVVVFNLRGREGTSLPDETKFPRVMASGGGSTRSYIAQDVGYECIVRRLTPLECERLQGFPDDFTKIEWGGRSLEDCPDTPRFMATGNSMAVPVMRWILTRLERADATLKEIGMKPST